MVLQKAGNGGNHNIRVGVCCCQKGNSTDHGLAPNPMISWHPYSWSHLPFWGQRICRQKRKHSRFTTSQAASRAILPLYQGGYRIGDDLIPPHTGTNQSSGCVEQTLGAFTCMACTPADAILVWEHRGPVGLHVGPQVYSRYGRRITLGQ